MEQTRRIVRLIGEVLGGEVVGIYQHGSAVLGGLRPASDIDLLAVTRRSLTEAERRALRDGLLADSGMTGGLRPVELTVAVRGQLRPWRYPPVADFQYGEWLRAEFETGAVPRPERMPDLAVLVAQVLAGDHAFAGPPPGRVLDPVPPADVARASLAGVPALAAEAAEDTRNVLLTLARVWCTLVTGEIRPKDAAADWALPRLPPEHRPALAHVRDLYRGARYDEEHWSPSLRAGVRPLVDALRAEIDAAAARQAP